MATAATAPMSPSATITGAMVCARAAPRTESAAPGSFSLPNGKPEPPSVHHSPSRLYTSDQKPAAYRSTPATAATNGTPPSSSLHLLGAKPQPSRLLPSSAEGRLFELTF